MTKHEFLPFLYLKEEHPMYGCREGCAPNPYSVYYNVELTEDFGPLKKGDRPRWCRLSFDGFFRPLHIYFFSNDSDFEISFKISKIQIVKET